LDVEAIETQTFYNLITFTSFGDSMKITVENIEKVQIKFEGKVNMSQEVSLSKEDAKKLGDILSNDQSESFETQ